MRLLGIFLLVFSFMSGGSALAFPTMESTFAHVVSYSVVSDMKVHVVLSDMSYAAEVGCSPAYYLMGHTSNTDQPIQIHWFEEQIRILADAITSGQVVIAHFTNDGPCAYPELATEIEYLTRTHVAEMPPVGGDQLFQSPSIMYWGQECTEWQGYSNGETDDGQDYRIVDGILEAPERWCDDLNNDDPAYTCQHGCPVN